MSCKPLKYCKVYNAEIFQVLLTSCVFIIKLVFLKQFPQTFSFFFSVVSCYSIEMELILLIAVLSFVTIFNLFSSYFKASKNIKGKVVLITGGGNGLGKGLCLEFAKLGCDVVIADIDIEAANKTSNEITEKFNIKSKSYKVDVSNFDEIESFKNQVYEDFGKVDILINNAGIISYSTIFKESINFIDKLIKVNFTGCIIITKVFLEDMIKRNSGHIVSISSLGGLYHIPTSVNYCATKFGVTGFMLGLREFLRCAKLDNQIYLTTIYPDVIATQDHVINSVSKK